MRYKMNCDPEPDYEAMSGLLVAVIDEKHPELLAGAWDWSKLDGEEWSLLLQDQPQFADICDWSKLDDLECAEVLAKQPQLVGKYDLADFDGEAWSILMREQPQFAYKCGCWGEMDGWHLTQLLKAQPQLATFKAKPKN